MEEIRLFSYKMQHDTGFAPNPFQGFLTLANCKPYIRRSKIIGDWIAGFTSKGLNGDGIGYERLIYLMKVTNKIDYNEYWNNPIFNSKKPNLRSDNVADKAGDNIYMPISPNEFVQIENKNHLEEHKDRDIKGAYVLVSSCFYYFGSSAIYIPNDIRPSVPKGQSSQGNRTQDQKKAEKFIKYIQEHYEQGIIGLPYCWPKSENK